jgi:methionyl aminopeptidase
VIDVSIRWSGRYNRAISIESPADGWTIRTRDGSLAAHHQHTIVVTERAPILLTAA